MPLLILAVLAIVLLVALFWITKLVFGFILLVLAAGFIGWAANKVLPGRLPGGWASAVLTGIVGGFLGDLLFRLFNVPLGFTLQGIHVIPAFVGAILLAVVAQFVTRSPRNQYA